MQPIVFSTELNFAAAAPRFTFDLKMAQVFTS